MPKDLLCINIIGIIFGILMMVLGIVLYVTYNISTAYLIVLIIIGAGITAIKIYKIAKLKEDSK